MLPIVLRALAFVVVFFGLQRAWAASAGTALERLVIDTLTVEPATYAINLLTPDVHAQAVRWSIRASGGGIDILTGCDGLDVLFVLLAALVVAPLPLRTRVTAMLLGTPFVYALNQLRIVVLFYAYRTAYATFELLHTLILPVVMIAIVALYFYSWLGAPSRPSAAS